MTKQEIKNSVNANIFGQGNQVDISGKLPSIITSIVDLIPDFVTEFVPKVAFETEEISMGEAVIKYGLTDEIFDKMTKGLILWVSLGASDASTRLAITNRVMEKSISSGGFSITLTDDGKFNIVIPS